MIATFQALALESGFAIFALLALAGAAAAYAYVPVLGRPLAAVLLAVAAGLVAYDAGYIARGRLDQSGALSAELAQEKRDAVAAQKIAGDAATRQRAAEAQADTLNQRIADYEKRIAARDALVFLPAQAVAAKPSIGKCPAPDLATCGCLLSGDDARRLRGLTAR